MMSRAPTIADPRGAELEAMLRRLGPRDELVYRRALFGLSPHCRGDHRWQARVDELTAWLKLREDGLAAVLRAARTVQDELLSLAGAPPIRRSASKS